jgi:hypothetical protein
VPAYPENTEQLNKQLEEDEGIPLPTDQAEQHTSARKPRVDSKLQDDKRILLKINLKRIREQQAMDDILAQKRRKTTTPSST